jgi:hypothetical protein
MQKALTAKSVENGQNSMENASKYRRNKRQTQPEVALRRQARGSRRDSAFDVPRDRHEGVHRGRQGLPLLSQNLGVERTQVWRYQRSNAGPRPGRRRSHVLDRARKRSKRKSPPDLFRRALIVLLSARDRSARIIENARRKRALKPIARGDICHPIPSRPVRVMATTIVRVHRRGRNRRHRVARHDGVNNSRPMMSSVSLILTISLGERRSTEQSNSRYCC